MYKYNGNVSRGCFGFRSSRKCEAEKFGFLGISSDYVPLKYYNFNLVIDGMIVLGPMIIEYNITCQNPTIRFTSYSNLDNVFGIKNRRSSDEGK